MSRDFSVYEKAMGRMQQRDQRRSSSSGDFVWFQTTKPARKGEQARQRIRVVPRPDGNGGHHAEFWVSIDQHMVRIDGKNRAFVCPDDHDDPSAEKRCPLCRLSRELYASREAAYLQAAKEANARQRVFCNVLDLDDDQHPESPKVWGFSKNILFSILDICTAKRAFIEDLEVGRDLLLTTRRIGPQKFDIRYAVTDCDTSPVTPDWATIAKEAPDLEDLAKPASLDELHEIAAKLDPRKGSKRGGYTPQADTGSYSRPAPAAEPAPAPAPPKAPSAPPAPPVAAPPAPPAPVADDGFKWHYSGPNGQQEGLSTAAVVKAVRSAPGADHHVWRDGMGGWEAATEVPEISGKLAPPAPPSPSGPPAPPTPRSGNAF